MFDRLFEFPGIAFTIPALFGSAVFLIKMGLMLIGGVGDVDVDTGVDVDLDGDVDLADSDSTSFFAAVSLQSLAALVMGFGWGGLLAHIVFEQGLATCIVTAVAVGAAHMWLLTKLLRSIRRFEGSGNVNLRDAVGRDGTVYARIPAPGSGRVRVVIDERERFFDALAEEPLDSGTRIRVTGANSDHTLTVRRA